MKAILMSISPEVLAEKALQKLEECSLKNEQRKEVANYEGLYLISNLGNVFSIPRYRKHGGLLKPQISKEGYRMQLLTKNNQSKLCKVSRLVAKAFIPNPNNYPVVNHINGIKTDDFVENLEWCSISHNTKEAYRLGLQKPCEYQRKVARRYCIENKSIKIRAIKYPFVKTYPSMSEASRELNIPVSCISRVVRKKRKQANGYRFEEVI